MEPSLKYKIYIDTNLISRLSDPLKGNTYQITDIQAEALLKICESNVELVTSKKMLDEVLRTKDLRQRALLTLVATIAAKTPYKDIANFIPAVFGGVMLGASTFGGGYSSPDPLFEGLKSIFDQDDAEHIFQAVKNDCAYFLTLDQATIIGRIENNKERLTELCPNIKFVNPEKMLELLIPKP